MKNNKQDILCGAAFVVLGCLIRGFRDVLITGKIETAVYGPLTFPTLIAYGMILCGALLMITSYNKYKQAKAAAIADGTYTPEAEKLTTPIEYVKREWKVLAFMAISLVYVLLLRKVGYLIVSFVATTLILLMMNARKKSYYIATYTSIIVLYVGFLYGLQVQLPLGSWFGF